MKGFLLAGVGLATWGLTGIARCEVPPAPAPPARVVEKEVTAQQAEVAAVAAGLQEAVRREKWTEAAGLFSDSFRRAHEAELDDGSLFRKGKAGKTVTSLLTSPEARVVRISLRGDEAWAEIRTEGPATGQQGAMALALRREQGAWRIVTYPPAPGTLDAARADIDGAAAGRWAQFLLRDRRLDAEEQAQLEAVLPAYGGLVGQLRWRSSPKARTSMWRPATPRGISNLASGQQEVSQSELVRLVFYRKPGEKEAAASQALAKRALQGIYDDIAAAKSRFAELSQFDREHVRFTTGGFTYGSAVRKKGEGFARPVVGVRFGVPMALGAAQTNSHQVIFPSQNLAVSRIVAVKNAKLAAFVKATIEKHLGPVERREKQQGGETLHSSW